MLLRLDLGLGEAVKWFSFPSRKTESEVDKFEGVGLIEYMAVFGVELIGEGGGGEGERDELEGVNDIACDGVVDLVRGDVDDDRGCVGLVG